MTGDRRPDNAWSGMGTGWSITSTLIAGMLAWGGIGYLLIQYMNLLQFNQAATVLWMIVIVVTVMDYASAAIRSRLI